MVPAIWSGHLAFLDTRDRALIAGDAFQTLGGVAVSGTFKLLFLLPALAIWHKGLALEIARKLLPYITGKVSNTVIWAPPSKTGQRLAISTAASSELALIMEYPLAIVPTGASLTVPSLAMRYYDDQNNRFALSFPTDSC